MLARAASAVLVGLLVLASVAFVSGVGPTDRVEPAPFEDSIVLTDLTEAELKTARANDLEIPRAEVFYSRYRYVVGHVGLSSLVVTLQGDAHARQFGAPLDVLVTDYASADLALTEAGYLTKTGGYSTWVSVVDAYFVVDSDARRPGGGVVVPFSDEAAASDFADEHDGRVVDWQTLRARDYASATLSVAAGDALGDERAAWADAAVARAHGLAPRPASVTVGVDAPTLAEAVERAPPNTTVRLPPGTYRDVNVTVRKPLTIAGAGAGETTLVGTGNGSVVRAFGAAVSIRDLRIEGVGTERGGPNVSIPGDPWDALVMRSYAHAASGVAFENASGSSVVDVRIDTPTNGVTIRYSDGVVVENVHVTGRTPWREGFMGTLAAHSRVVVQASTFDGGRDGVYLHVADGTVIRDNEFADLRFGVHEMYTSETLVERNAATNTSTGIVVMTRPERNVVRDNAVTNSAAGVEVAGRSSYVLRNVVVGNEVGLDVGSYRSLYAENTVYGNDVGIRGSTLIPTNTVTANDVVATDRFATTIMGPIRVWTARGQGNYWAGAPGFDADGDGVLDRAFHPTGTVDRHAGQSPDVHVLATSPAVRLLRSRASSMPGLRPTGAIDVAPRAGPSRPWLLDQIAAAPDAPPTAWLNATTGRNGTVSGTTTTARHRLTGGDVVVPDPARVRPLRCVAVEVAAR